MRKSRLAIISSLVMLAVLGATATLALAATGNGSAELRREVTTDRILQHERQFQRIAAANGNTRASGPEGIKTAEEAAT